MADGMDPEDFLNELDAFKSEIRDKNPNVKFPEDLRGSDRAAISADRPPSKPYIPAEPPSAPVDRPGTSGVVRGQDMPERGRRANPAGLAGATSDGRRFEDHGRVTAPVGVIGGNDEVPSVEAPQEDPKNLAKLLIAAILTVIALSWIATSCLDNDSAVVDTSEETTSVTSATTEATTATTAAATTAPAPTVDVAADANAALAAAGLGSVIATAEGGNVVLSGTVDTEEQRLVAVETVNGVAGVEQLMDEIVVAPPLPQADLQGEAVAALEAAGIAGITATVDGSAAVLTGEAANGEQRLAAQVAVLSVPGIETVDNQITTPPTEGEILAGTLNDIVKLNPIQFNTGSADIRTASKATLDEAIAVLVANPVGAVEIGGHTDSDGGKDANQALSQARAQSVLDYLVAGGVDASRLTAVGYGETTPLVANDSSDNKKKNRRIEFKVS